MIVPAIIVCGLGGYIILIHYFIHFILVDPFIHDPGEACYDFVNDKKNSKNDDPDFIDRDYEPNVRGDRDGGHTPPISAG